MNIVRGELIFPTILVALNCVASIVYAAHGDTRKAIYWAASAVIISAVTF